MEKSSSNNRIWIRVAQVAGAFAFIISVLLIVNYVQYKSIDPVETELINTLVDRLNKNPDDVQLRDQVRAIDLLSRKAYFTNQWQVRTGGYLLLLCIGVLVIAMQMIKSKSDKQIDTDSDFSSFEDQKKARKWVSIGGGILVATALVLAYLTHTDFTGFPETNEIGLITNEDVEVTEVIENVTPEAENQKVETIIPEDTITTDPVKNKEVVINTKDPEIVPKEKTTEKNTKKVEPVKTSASYPSEKEINNNHPSFRGPGGNGISYKKNIPISWDGSTGDNVLWKLEVPIHGYNSPIIWGDKIFLSGATPEKREVYCVDKNSGKIIWTVDVKGIEGSPDKSPATTEDTGLAAPSLATDGQRVYAIFGNGDLISTDMEGKTVWSKNMGKTDNHYGHSSSLYLYQNILILQYDTKTTPKLFGLSTETGEIIWETDRNVRISWASPIIVNTGDKTEVILAADPIVASYDPLTGKENWSIDCIFGEVGPSPAYSDGIVYAMNEYAILVAIQIGEEPKIIWESDEYLSDVPSPVATKELFFMATSYGAFVCYNAKTGEQYWEQEFDNGFYSSPMLVDGKIYIMDMAGIMHIFKAEKTYEKVGEAPIGENCMTTPAFTDNRIYIRGNKHLFCIGK